MSLQRIPLLGGRRRRKGGGRRANYAPAKTEVGWRKYLPITWANWLGFFLFGFITIALAAETVTAAAEGRGNDPYAAAVMTVVFAVMTYLFGSTRFKE